MLETTYKRIEQTVILIMLLGIVAMFQPWFSNIVNLFEGFAPEARLERTYRREIAPIIFRFGFYATLLGTIAFIVISHYSPENLREAVKEKGLYLTIYLIALPVIYGLTIITNLAWDSSSGAILNLINFVCAIAIWNRAAWGVPIISLSTLYGLRLGFGTAISMSMAMFNLILALVLIALLWLYQRALLTTILDRLPLKRP